MKVLRGFFSCACADFIYERHGSCTLLPFYPENFFAAAIFNCSAMAQMEAKWLTKSFCGDFIGELKID